MTGISEDKTNSDNVTFITKLCFKIHKTYMSDLKWYHVISWFHWHLKSCATATLYMPVCMCVCVCACIIIGNPNIAILYLYLSIHHTPNGVWRSVGSVLTRKWAIRFPIACRFWKFRVPFTSTLSRKHWISNGRSDLLNSYDTSIVNDMIWIDWYFIPNKHNVIHIQSHKTAITILIRVFT